MVKVNSQNYISWGEEKIGNLCKLINGRAFKSSEWTDTGLPIVRIQNLNDETKAFNYYDGFVDKKHKVYNGDILLSWSGTPGTSFGVHLWNRGDAVLNQHIFKVYLNESRCTKKFFVYAVNLRLKELIRQAHGGVGLRHITKSKLQNITIPLPFPKDAIRSLDIQHHIVSHIESLLDELKGDHQLLEKMRRDTDRLMDVTLEEVFHQLEKSGVDLIPIQSILLKKPQYGLSIKASDAPPGIPILRMGNITKRGGLSFDDLKYVSLSAREVEKYILNDGDILFNRTNSAELVGKTAVFENKIKAVFASYLIRLVVNKSQVQPKYIASYINSVRGRTYIQSQLSRAIGQVNVNAQKISAMPVLVPDIKVQEQIVAYFDSIQSEVDTMLKIMQQDAQLLERLEQSILEKAFQGQL